jgi:hypothetical protein
MVIGWRSSAVLLSIVGCSDSLTQPNDPPLSLAYPAGVEAELPHQCSGESVLLSALVVDHRGKPVEGATVRWQDGSAFPALNPIASQTDSTGVATTNWRPLPLSESQGFVRRTVQVALPGARNNPLGYRLEVVRCTKDDPGSN